MSKYRLPEEDWDNHQDLPCAPDDDGRGCPRHHSYPPKFVMSCGNGIGITLPVDCKGSRGKHQPALVAGTVNVNTGGLMCPTVKIDFSTMINFKAESRDGEFYIRIIFQLSKACDGGPKIPLGNWVYQKEVDIDRYRKPIRDGGDAQPMERGDSKGGGCGSDIEIGFKEAFSFTWCECNDCSECCLYVVEVVDIDADYIECLYLSNVGINAIAG